MLDGILWPEWIRGSSPDLGISRPECSNIQFQESAESKFLAKPNLFADGVIILALIRRAGVRPNQRVHGECRIPHA